MRENLPSKNNQTHYPTNSDIQNHIDAANAAIQLSTFDQVSMKALYEEWTKSAKPGKYFFHPYIKKEPIPNPVPSAADEVVVIASTIAAPVPSTPPTVSSVPKHSSSQPPSHLETPATDSPDSSSPDSSHQFSQTLWIQQQEWQQNLMIRYGNTVLNRCDLQDNKI